MSLTVERVQDLGSLEIATRGGVLDPERQGASSRIRADRETSQTKVESRPREPEGKK